MKKRFWRTVFLFFMAASFLIGCNGGGDSGGGGAVIIPTSGNTYTGSSSQADITQDNADEISTGAFENAMSATGFSLDSQAGSDAATVTEDLLDIIGQGLASDLDLNAVGVQEITKTIEGQCGGTAYYQVEVNLLTKEFWGYMEFTDFCNSNILQNGKAEFSGAYDPDTQTFGEVQLAFVDMVTSFSGVDRTMNGSWTYLKEGATRTVTMNYDVYNSVAQNIRRVEDFVLVWTLYETYKEFTVAGKFYHPLYGYVVVSTTTSFRINEGDSYPSQGVLVVTGANSRAARLTCVDASTFVVDADLDGDGQFDDWTSGEQTWQDIQYKGPATLAEIEQSNAAAIVLAAFDNAMTASGFFLPQSIGNTADQTENLLAIIGPGVFEAGLNVESRAQEITRTIDGLCGGTATYTITVYPLLQTFEGSLEFQNFCNNDITQNGTAEFNGTYDAQAQTFGEVALTFKNMSTTYYLVTRVMNGTWTYVRSGDSRTVTMNYAVYNSLSQDVRMVENFVLTVTAYDTYREFEVSGNFYHPDYGYVVVATPTKFVLNDGDAHVSQGVLVATGFESRKVRFTALSAATYQVEADTNGDGTYDWDSGVLNWQ